MIPRVIILSLLRRQFVALGQCSLLRLGMIREACLFLTSIYSPFLLNASDASLFLIFPFRLAVQSLLRPPRVASVRVLHRFVHFSFSSTHLRPVHPVPGALRAGMSEFQVMSSPSNHSVHSTIIHIVVSKLKY
jgi:hypothetical protein